MIYGTDDFKERIRNYATGNMDVEKYKQYLHTDKNKGWVSIDWCPKRRTVRKMLQKMKSRPSIKNRIVVIRLLATCYRKNISRTS